METSRKLAFLALVSFFCCFPKDGRCGAQTARDSLTYYGHSFVKIKTAQGIVIYVDPYNVNAFADSADAVLITHEHTDHNEIGRVIQKSGCQIILAANALSGNSYSTFTIGSVTIQGFPAYNNYHAKSSCVGFVLSFNGIKIYHAGDTGSITEMADLTAQHITYALIPMDGVYTMTPEVATTVASTIQAVHDIPIHTLAPPDTYSDAIVGRFASPNKCIVHPDSTIALVTSSTRVEGSQSALPGFRLNQNYPNPFNPSTTIIYEVPEQSRVTLTILDLLGREVAEVVNQLQPAGRYTSVFDASMLTSGVYFYRLTAGSYARTNKMILLR